MFTFIPTMTRDLDSTHRDSSRDFSNYAISRGHYFTAGITFTVANLRIFYFPGAFSPRNSISNSASAAFILRRAR